MKKIMTPSIAVVWLLLSPPAIMARDGQSGSGKSSTTRSPSYSANHFASGNLAAKKSTTLASSSHRSTSVDGVQRDAKGRVERSSTPREKFMRSGYPPAHVVDHSIQLKRGGSDSPSGKALQIAKPRTK